MENEKTLYYKEQIVDGVLCCRRSKDGEWVPLSPEKMTRKISKMKVEIERLTYKLDIASRKVHETIG